MNLLSRLTAWASRLIADVAGSYTGALPAGVWAWPAPKPALLRVRELADGEGWLIGARMFVPALPEGFEVVDRSDVPGYPPPAPGFVWVRVSSEWMARDQDSPAPALVRRCRGDWRVEGWWRDAVRGAA